MEPIIAVLILIGALIVGGNALDKEATRSGNESAATATLADGEAQDRQVCDNQGPRQRDLTVPLHQSDDTSVYECRGLR